MFKKDDSSYDGGQAQDTIIAHGVKVEGEFISQGNIIIEGEVHGIIKTERDLRVGEQARVIASVTADNAVIAGVVKGNVKINESLELTPTSRITGDIKAKIVTMSPGAILNGKFQMPGGPEEVVVEEKLLKKRSRTKSSVVDVEIEEPQPLV